MYDPVGPTPLWQNGRVLGGILFIHWDHLKSRVLNLKRWKTSFHFTGVADNLTFSEHCWVHLVVT